MSENRILDNTVTPLVGHFKDPYKFVCDEELNMNKLQNATVKFKVGNINGRTNYVNSLPTTVDEDLNNWQKFTLGDNLDFFVYLTRTDGYYNYQAPIYNYRIGSLDSPINLGQCEAWSNDYNVGGDKNIKDVDLQASSNNEFYTLKHYQPQISNNAYITWIAVYDNLVNKIYLCEPTNVDDLGILTDFKIASSDHLLNFIDDFDYNYPNLLDKNLDNEFLSIISTADIMMMEMVLILVKDKTMTTLAVMEIMIILQILQIVRTIIKRIMIAHLNLNYMIQPGIVEHLYIHYLR